jgi:hypothetical protein
MLLELPCSRHSWPASAPSPAFPAQHLFVSCSRCLAGLAITAVRASATRRGNEAKKPAAATQKDSRNHCLPRARLVLDSRGVLRRRLVGFGANPRPQCRLAGSSSHCCAGAQCFGAAAQALWCATLPLGSSTAIWLSPLARQTNAEWCKPVTICLPSCLFLFLLIAPAAVKKGLTEAEKGLWRDTVFLAAGTFPALTSSHYLFKGPSALEIREQKTDEPLCVKCAFTCRRSLTCSFPQESSHDLEGKHPP